MESLGLLPEPIQTGLISALSIERERHLNGDLERFCSVAPNK